MDAGSSNNNNNNNDEVVEKPLEATKINIFVKCQLFGCFYY